MTSALLLQLCYNYPSTTALLVCMCVVEMVCVHIVLTYLLCYRKIEHNRNSTIGQKGTPKDTFSRQ